jgi:ribosomal protein L11 methyltransferase
MCYDPDLIVLPVDSLRTKIVSFIAASPSKVRFDHLKRHINETTQTNVRFLKKVVTELVQEGTLSYTYHFGQSFIDLSYDRPLTVSDHVVIKPPWCSWSATDDQRVVSIARGASFGGGDHPSTRLAIQLIDTALHLPVFRYMLHTLKGIDIGTGSGILAIVAAKIGVGAICGIDTDPCAIFEAGENIRLNHLENRVTLYEDNLNTFGGPYDLVLANLRAPTLSSLRAQLDTVMAPDSLLVFSGLKSRELTPMANHYKKAGCFLVEKRTEAGWGALCLARGALSNALAGTT